MALRASLIFANNMQISRIVINIRKLIWPRTLKSHPASKALRTVFESKNLRKILGLGLVVLVVLLGQQTLGVAADQIPADNPVGEKETNFLAIEETEIKTISGTQSPLENFLITQGYWFFHKAIDMAAPWGTEIKPIKKGRVVKANNGGWPWGKAVLIDHGSGLGSFYAHLAEIGVEEGEEVDEEVIIGKVGVTGRATGAHLHLEIHQNGEAIDPREFIVTDRK